MVVLTSSYINRPKYSFVSEPMQDESSLAHELIGDIYYKMAQCIKKNESIPSYLLKELGVHPKDKESLESMSNISRLILTKSHHIIPTDDPGVFYILETDSPTPTYKDQDISDLLKKVKKQEVIPKAVFKVGRKRAQLEMIARRIADMVGLKEHSIFGMFGALKMKTLPSTWSDDSVMTEELWNENMKCFEDHFSNKSTYVVGILQPFLSNPKQEATTEEEEITQMAKMTALAIVLGLRDADERNIIGHTFIDVEEFFPIRLDPDSSQKKAAAAHHLPYLFDNPYCQKPIPKKAIIELYQLLKSIDPLELATEFSKIKKKYYDTCADQIASEVMADLSPQLQGLNLSDETSSDNSSDALSESESSISSDDEDDIVFRNESDDNDPVSEEIRDEGGNYVTIEHSEKEINPLYTPNETPFVFSKMQCATFSERYLRLLRHLENAITSSESSLTCLNLVEKVDPFFAYQIKRCRHSSEVGRSSSQCIDLTALERMNSSPQSLGLGS